MTGEKNKLLQTIKSRAFLKSLMILVLGLLLISSPLILFLGNISFSRALEIKNIKYIDNDEDGLYDGLKITLSLPIQNALIKDLVFYQSGITFNWRVLPENAVVKKNNPVFLIEKAPEERQILPNTNLGIGVIYSLTGSLGSVATYVYRTRTPFLLPEGGDYYIGVYYNLSRVGGLVDGSNSESTYLALRENFRGYEGKNVKVFRVTDETIALYMELFNKENYWLLFTSDTLPAHILPSITVEEGPLIKYIKNGGRLVFLGGEPLKFVAGNQGIKISNKLRDNVFPKKYDLAPSLLKSGTSQNYYTELGKVIVEKTDVDFYSSSFPVDIKYVNDSRYDVEVFARSVDGRYADPALLHYRYGSKILFSYLGPVTTAEQAASIATDTSLILQYLFERDDPSTLKIQINKQVDLNVDGRVEALRLDLVNKKKFDSIISATLQDLGSDSSLYISKQYWNDEIVEQIEILVPDQISVGDTFSVTLEIDRNFDGEADFTYTANLEVTSPQVVDLILYSEYNFAPISFDVENQKILDSYLVSKAEEQGLSYLYVSPQVLSYIIEKNLTLSPVITISEALPSDLFPSGKLKGWIDRGGVIATTTNYLGSAILQSEKSETGGSYYLEVATSIPQSAVVSGDFVFHPTYIADVLGNFSSSYSQFGLNLNALRSNNIIAIEVSENVIGSFILSQGEGNYIFIPTGKISAINLAKSLYAENLFSVVRKTDQFSSLLNGTIALDSVKWYSINGTSEVQLVEISLRSYVYNFTDIQQVLINGIPTEISSTHLVSGIKNRVTVLLPKSNYIANNSVVTLQVDTTGTPNIAQDIAVTSKIPNFLLFKDPMISNFFTYEEVLIPEKRANNFVTIGERQMIQIIEDKLFPVIVNSHDFLPMEVFNGNGENSSLFSWIQAGGDYVHVAPLFGLIVHNESGFTILDENIYQQTFGTTPFVYHPFTYVNLNESGLVITNYSLDVDNLINEGYNVTSLISNINYTLAATISGNSINGVNLGTGSLTLISIYFSLQILNFLELQLLEVINS